MSLRTETPRKSDPAASSGCSILLIDLENFYMAREQSSLAYAAGELSSDLEASARGG